MLTVANVFQIIQKIALPHYGLQGGVKILWRHIWGGPEQRDETWQRGRGVIFS